MGDALPRRLVEDMHSIKARRQVDAIAREQPVPLAEYRLRLATGETRDHEDFGAGRLNDDDLGYRAALAFPVWNQVEMLGAYAVNYLLAIGASDIGG